MIDVSGKGRVLVYSLGYATSGIPQQWAASNSREGINRIENLSTTTVQQIASQINDQKQPGDIIVVSIHWGGNWGYTISDEYADFAHQLIDNAQVDMIHSHSSHHPRGLEVYQGKLILYGCGDFINDYEGISGYEAFRSDLTLMYLPRIDPKNGRLTNLEFIPMQIKHFRLHRATPQDSRWVKDMLNQSSEPWSTHITLKHDNRLLLQLT